MDAQLKKIQITPTKFNDENDIVKDRFATVTFEIDMSTLAQREAITALQDLTDKEFVILTVEPYQTKL